MLKALEISGIYGAAEAALMTAVERAIAILGVGTIVALALALLVVGVEALTDQWVRQMKRRKARVRPTATRKRRRAAYR